MFYLVPIQSTPEKNTVETQKVHYAILHDQLQQQLQGLIDKPETIALKSI